jgi:hypothetical protein
VRRDPLAAGRWDVTDKQEQMIRTFILTALVHDPAAFTPEEVAGLIKCAEMLLHDRDALRARLAEVERERDALRASVEAATEER